VVVAVLLVVVGPDRPRPTTLLPPRFNGKSEAATAVYKLLMMGKRMPETCWAVFKRQALNLRDLCIWLVDSFECLMKNGLAKPIFHYRVDISAPLVSIQSQNNPIHTLMLYVFKFHFNIVLSLTSRCSTFSLSLRYFDRDLWDFLCMSCVLHTCLLPPPYFTAIRTSGEQWKSRSSCLCSCIHPSHVSSLITLSSQHPIIQHHQSLFFLCY
jgi:hypothetical protein